MKKIMIICIAAICAFASSCNQVTQYEGWELVWHDEFNKDGAPNPEYWSFEEGFVRNKELQWYQKDNAVCEDGLLVIEGRKERVKNDAYEADSQSWQKNREYAEYTSSCIKTNGKFEFLYGRMEVRARIPVSPGSWPAIWTLGSEVHWPDCGEIDVMEYYEIDGEPHILANAAWGDRRGGAKWDTTTVPFAEFLEKDPEWASKFHVWRMDWDQEAIRLYLDDELLNETLLSETVNGPRGKFINPFKTPQYILLNLAMGSNGGDIDESQLPMRYEIDYVRVYQKEKKPYTAFHPGKIWEDTDGVHINAHGGGVLYHEGKYYFYGEHKSEHTSSAMVGVNVYSSEDLYNWKKEGVAMAVMPEGSGHKIEKGCIIERPKVVYNAKTGKFVMWFHLELKGRGYAAAEYGVAVSDSPVGPFEYQYAQRSCPGTWPINMTEEEIKYAQANSVYDEASNNWGAYVRAGGYVARDHEVGQMSRDMTVFVDDDGTAYHIFSSEENQTLHIARLTDDYLYHDGTYSRVLEGDSNEAPAIFKKDGKYWMISSGCTGWDPNPARLSSADDILGEWTSYPNPCVGPKSEITFGAQSTFILPVHGKENCWIFMADIWTPRNPINARYVWLPITFDENGVPVVEWKDEWSL